MRQQRQHLDDERFGITGERSRDASRSHFARSADSHHSRQCEHIDARGARRHQHARAFVDGRAGGHDIIDEEHAPLGDRGRARTAKASPDVAASRTILARLRESSRERINDRNSIGCRGDAKSSSRATPPG